MEDMPKVYRSAMDGKYYRYSGQPETPGLREFKAAGAILPDDIADIQAITVLDEVLGLARPAYTLEPICRSVRMDKLTARIPIATSLAGQEKVPPMEEAKIVAEAYTKVDFDLPKNVVHVVVADETGMKAAHDILGMNIEDAARDIARMRNKQISECLDLCDNAQAAAGGSSTTHTWDTSTSGVSDANPWIDLLEAFIAIAGDGFTPDRAVMHPQVWAGFITNDWVRNQVDVGLGRVSGSQISLPGFPTVGVHTDFAVLPITSCYVMSKSAPGIVLGDGPTSAAKYRDEKAGYDAYIIRDWLQPKIIDFGTGKDAIVDITGAHG